VLKITFVQNLTGALLLKKKLANNLKIEQRNKNWIRMKEQFLFKKLKGSIFLFSRDF